MLSNEQLHKPLATGLKLKKSTVIVIRDVGKHANSTLSWIWLSLRRGRARHDGKYVLKDTGSSMYGLPWSSRRPRFSPKS